MAAPLMLVLVVALAVTCAVALATGHRNIALVALVAALILQMADLLVGREQQGTYVIMPGGVSDGSDEESGSSDSASTRSSSSKKNTSTTTKTTRTQLTTIEEGVEESDASSNDDLDGDESPSHVLSTKTIRIHQPRAARARMRMGARARYGPQVRLEAPPSRTAPHQQRLEWEERLRLDIEQAQAAETARVAQEHGELPW